MIDKILNLSMETTCKVGNDVWKFKFLRPKERLLRTSIQSQLLNLAPIESVSPQDYNRAYVLATFGIAFLAGPDWFDAKYKKDFLEIPDETYLTELWVEYETKETKFEDAKKKLRLGQGSEKESMGS